MFLFIYRWIFQILSQIVKNNLIIGFRFRLRFALRYSIKCHVSINFHWFFLYWYCIWYVMLSFNTQSIPFFIVGNLNYKKICQEPLHQWPRTPTITFSSKFRILFIKMVNSKKFKDAISGLMVDYIRADVS